MTCCKTRTFDGRDPEPTFDPIATNVHITDTTPSTSSTTGALVVDGGVGIGGALNAGGVIKTFNTSDATSRTTGALIVAGGLGVSKKIYSGNHVITGTTSNELTIRDETNRTTGSSSSGYVNYNDSIDFIGDAQNRYVSAGGIPQTLASIVSQYSKPKGNDLWTGYFDFDQGAGEISIRTRDATATTSSTTMTEVAWFNSDNTSIHVPTTLTDTSNASSTTTGALVVSGGVGIAEEVYIGTNLDVLGDAKLYNNVYGDGNLTLIGGTAAGNQITLISTTNASKGNIVVADTTQSTSATTGALVVQGGIGVAKNIVGDSLFIYGGSGANIDLTLNSTTNASKGSILIEEMTPSTSLSSGAFIVSGGAAFGLDLHLGGDVLGHGPMTITGGDSANNDLTLRSTTNATKGSVLVDELTSSSSVTTGALVVSGGMGLGEDLHLGGNITGHTLTTVITGSDGANDNLVLRSTSNATKGYVYIDESTASTSTSTGALRIDGGMGIAKGIYAGGEILYSGVSISDTSNTSGIYATSVTTKYIRMGNTVTLEIPDILATAGSATILTLGLTLPVGYRPLPNNMNFVCRIRDNAVDKVAVMQVTTAGVVNIYASISAGNFAGTGSSGILATTVTFVV